MRRYASLISILSFTLSADALFSAAIIWCVLLAGGTAKSLAFFLCVVTLFAFFIKKFSTKLKKHLEIFPQKSFMIIRIIGAISSILFIPLSIYNHSLNFLYITGIIFTVISFLSQLTSETMIGQAVLSHHLTPNQGSRLIQMAQQIAAFLGPAIMSVTLSWGGMSITLLMMSLTYSSGIFVYFIAKNFFTTVHKETSAETTKTFSGEIALNLQDNFLAELTLFKRSNLWVLFISLCFLTLQIAVFNFLIPLIAQHEKFWSATQFGLIDTLAGIGAFICTMLSLESGWKKSLWVISCSIIPLCDLGFYIINNAYYVAIIAIFLGFFVNAYWIKSREFIYSSVNCTTGFMQWISRITIMSVFIKSAAPILLTFTHSQPSYLFFIVGLVVGIGMLITNIILI